MEIVAKQNCIFELLKEFISLNKIIERNQGEESDPIDQRQLPFFLIKFVAGSKISIVETKHKNQLQVQSDNPFDVMNTNHLFQGMGLTTVKDEKELDQTMPPALV